MPAEGSRRGLLAAAWLDGAVHIRRCVVQESHATRPGQPDACWVPGSLHWATVVVKSMSGAKHWAVFPV